MLAASLLLQGSRLDRERNPDRMEAASVAIAASTDAAAMADLARHLSQRGYLQRLDPGSGVTRLGHVFRTLAEHPSPSAESLCIVAAGSAEFNEVPARMNFLLNALAAVRPMSEPAAKIFRSSSRSGFLEVDGPLLAANASPRALGVLAELLRDESIDAAQRVSIAHWGLLPNRTNPDVVAMCDRVLSAGVSRDVEIAILESLYDYQPRQWFSLRAGQPSPPSWNTASPAARDALRSLAASRVGRSDLPPALRAAMENSLAQMRRLP
jgi:hypothetical protein